MTREAGRPFTTASKGARTGLTLVEMLVVLLILGIVSTAVYRFFSRYFFSYVKVDERVESLSETWQVTRSIFDDAWCLDLPDGDPKKWQQVITKTGNGFSLARRRGSAIVQVQYLADPKTGDVFREEGGKRTSLLRNRCRELHLEFVPTIETGATEPSSGHIAVRLLLGDPDTAKDGIRNPASFSFSMTVFPVFLNQRLRGTYIHQGLPGKAANPP